MGYVYKITNTVNNKAYIGISVHEPTQGRITEHLLGRGNRIIANAVKKYGKDAFTYEVLEATLFDEYLGDLEKEYIAKFNTVVPHGYNLTYGGEFGVPCEEVCIKISNTLKGRKHTESTRRKISEAKTGKKRKPLTEEHKKKISKSQKGEKNHSYGKKASAETKRKLSEARRGEKNHFFGKKHTAETKRKISEAKKNPSKETRAKISKANRHPNYNQTYSYFLSLPPEMPLEEKRRLMYVKFPDIKKNTIRAWVRKWLMARRNRSVFSRALDSFRKHNRRFPYDA